MLYRKCISAGSLREAEPLFMMWNMGFIIGIWTYTLWDSVRNLSKASAFADFGGPETSADHLGQ